MPHPLASPAWRRFYHTKPYNRATECESGSGRRRDLIHHFSPQVSLQAQLFHNGLQVQSNCQSDWSLLNTSTSLAITLLISREPRWNNSVTQALSREPASSEKCWTLAEKGDMCSASLSTSLQGVCLL